MKKDYRKSMEQKARAKRRSKKYLVVGTSIVAGLMLGTAPITIATPLFTIGSQQVYADLVSGQLFNNVDTTNTSGTSVGAPYVADGSTRNVDFVISANNGLDVSLLTGTRRAVLAIPEEMQGLVAVNGSGTFSTDILLPGDELAPLLTVVNGAVSALVGSVENIVNLNPLASVNLSEVYEQLALLENLSTLSSTEVALALQQTENGDYIYGELDGTLELLFEKDLVRF
ncbi:cell wall-associated protease [Enterococcus durans]|uniref:Cell wall-associated protease n=1 Tax=Enterococcus durans TaxID=53345 RepID=A0A377KKI8_9ENTE|nr:cell wall-associated protease [Enterococcus durans]